VSQIEGDASNSSSIVAYVFVVAITFFTEPLPSNEREYTYRHRLTGGIFEVRRWYGFRCHDIHTKFYKDWFSHSKVGDDSLTPRRRGDRISLLFSLCFLFWYKKFWEELIAYFPWYDTGFIENDASNNPSIVECVFVTAVTFLPSRCSATIGDFTEPLPSNDEEIFTQPLPSNVKWIHTQTATWSHKPTFLKIRKVGLKHTHNVKGRAMQSFLSWGGAIAWSLETTTINTRFVHLMQRT
jgi:hypothetical protein